MAGEDLGFVTPEMAAAVGRRRRVAGDDDQEGLLPQLMRAATAQRGLPAPAQAAPAPQMTADGRPSGPLDASAGAPPAAAPGAAGMAGVGGGGGIVKMPNFNLAGVSPAPVQNPVQNIPAAESGVDRMRRLEGAREQLPPRPTDANAVPGAHHGGRKALDMLAAIAYGGLTLNPMAGKAIYDQMHGAPLRRAQDDWDTRHTANSEAFDQSKAISTGESAEQRAQAAEDRAKAAEEKNKNAIDPNSYFQDADGSWKAKTYGGSTVDAIPRAAQKEPPMPKTYEELVIKAKQEKDPEKKKAYEAAATELRDTEVRKFRAGNSGRAPTDLEVWLNAFKKDNNREPTAEEIAERHVHHASTFKDQAGVDKSYKGEYDKQEKEYQGRRSAILKRYGADKDPAEYKNNQEAIEGEIRDLDKWNEGEKSKLSDRKRGDETSLPAHGASAPKAASGGHKAGDQVMYKGKPHTIKAVNQDGTLELEAQ